MTRRSKILLAVLIVAAVLFVLFWILASAVCNNDTGFSCGG